MPIPKAKTAPTNWCDAIAAARRSAVMANATRLPLPSHRAAAQQAQAAIPAANTRAYTPPLTIQVHVAMDPTAASAATRPPTVEPVAVRTVP